MTVIIAPKKTSRENTLEVIAVNSRQACQLLNISTGTLTKLTREGKIPHVRIGYALRYPIEGLKKFVNGELSQDPQTPADVPPTSQPKPTGKKRATTE